jgi:SAM-dependent methyltransferase
VKELYDHYYDQASFELSSVVAASLDRIVLSLESFRQSGRWLDIGYGEGGLLTTAERRGWTCFGTEISSRALEFGTKRGWIVSSDPVMDRRFPAKGFDVISMIEILEHVASPNQILQTVIHLLQPGGVLYLTTPNAQSLNRRILGVKWSIFSPPEHLVIWTKKGLRHALTRHGLDLKRTRTEGLNPGEILQWLRPKKEGLAPSRNATGFKLNEQFSRSSGRRLVKAGINTCLSVLGLGDTLKAWAVQKVSK